MLKADASGLKDFQRMTSQNSKKQFEVTWHGEQNICSKMLEQNDRSSFLNGYTGTMIFLYQHPP